MFLLWIGIDLVFEQGEGADEFGPGIGWLDDVVDIAPGGGDIGFGNFIPFFFHFLLESLFPICRFFYFLLKNEKSANREKALEEKVEKYKSPLICFEFMTSYAPP